MLLVFEDCPWSTVHNWKFVQKIFKDKLKQLHWIKAIWRKIARKYLRLDMNLERILCLFICQFYSYRIAMNLIVPKNTPPKKMRALGPSFPFPRAILKQMCLLYGKPNRCWWNTRLVEVPHVHVLASWNVLWTVIFWLINLSDGLILLIFVLDLGLDVFDILFLIRSL